MKKMLVCMAMLFVSAVMLFTGCSAGGNRSAYDYTTGVTATTTYDNESTMIETTNALGYRNITPEEAKARLDSEKDIVLLDVRTLEEYTEKHIPKSILIPVDNIEKEASLRLTDKNAVIFVYCRSGRRSVIASEALVKLGYANVFNLGGIIDWPYYTEAGAPR